MKTDGMWTVFGTAKQYLDLKYVFSNIQFAVYTTKLEEVQHALEMGGYAVICTDDKIAIEQKLNAMYGSHSCCKDDDLIETLNFDIAKNSQGKRVCVWGTGYWCEEFEKYVNEKGLDVRYEVYVDNNEKKQGATIRGKKVLSADEINPNTDYIIIAANVYKCYEIEKQLFDIGFSSDSYVSIHEIMDDVADYFMLTYKENYIFDAKCKQKNNVRVRRNGNICMCCRTFKNILGNAFIRDFEDIQSSKRARISQLSLINKTFSFCDKERCPFLINLKKRKASEADISPIIKELQNAAGVIDVESFALETEESCNLHCVMCRDEVIVDKEDDRRTYIEMCADRLAHISAKFQLNMAGEVFFGKYSKMLLKDTRIKQRDQISIYTNGMLFSKEKLDEFIGEYKKIEIAVSVDAATKETYECTRRGGHWETLIKNLNNISTERESGNITYFQLNYVLHTKNMNELNLFVEMAEALTVDEIALLPIENWGTFTKQEYEKLAVFDNAGIKPEVANVLSQVLDKKSLINYYWLAHFIGAETKKMNMI